MRLDPWLRVWDLEARKRRGSTGWREGTGAAARRGRGRRFAIQS